MNRVVSPWIPGVTFKQATKTGNTSAHQPFVGERFAEILGACRIKTAAARSARREKLVEANRQSRKGGQDFRSRSALFHNSSTMGSMVFNRGSTDRRRAEK